MILSHVLCSRDTTSLSDYRTTLAALCFVNTMFHAECQAALFRTLRYSGRTRFAERRAIREWLDRLRANDARATHLAGCVHECSLVDWHPTVAASSEEPHWLFHSAVLETVACFPHLHTLELVRCPLTVGTPPVLARMTSVRNVVISECTCFPLGLEELPGDLPGGLWTSLTVTGTAGLRLLVPHLVRFVNLAQLYLLSSDDWSLVFDLVARQPAPALEDLRILSWDSSRRLPNALPSVLAHTPNLCRLHLAAGLPAGALMLGPRAVPHLHELTAEPAAAARLAPHRALTTVHLLGAAPEPLGPLLRTPDFAAHIRTLALPLAVLAQIGRAHV